MTQVFKVYQLLNLIITKSLKSYGHCKISIFHLKVPWVFLNFRQKFLEFSLFPGFPGFSRFVAALNLPLYQKPDHCVSYQYLLNLAQTFICSDCLGMPQFHLQTVQLITMFTSRDYLYYTKSVYL